MATDPHPLTTVRLSSRVSGITAACLLGLLAITSTSQAADVSAGVSTDVLAETEPLTESDPLDEVMVRGIDRFALRAIEEAREQRASQWTLTTDTMDSYLDSIRPFRERLTELIGAVDPRVSPTGIVLLGSTESPSMIANAESFTIHRVRWPTLDGIDAEGLFIRPKIPAKACVVAIPDADWTPEMIAGIEDCDTSFARDFASMGCEVLVPTLVSRDTTFSGNPEIGRKANLSHREFVYRPAFEVGRHIIGFEVQKVRAAVDQFKHRHSTLPIIVAGAGEGGLLALHSAALDERIDAAIVSGYFDERENAWQEPIYRNVWSLLHSFGDAEIAAMIAPRKLFIELNAQIPESNGPAKNGRSVAAPGSIRSPELASSEREFLRAQTLVKRVPVNNEGNSPGFLFSMLAGSKRTPLSRKNVGEALSKILDTEVAKPTQQAQPVQAITKSDVESRQRRQVEEMIDYTQALLRKSHRIRDRRFDALDHSTVETFVADANAERRKIHNELFGALPKPTMPPNPRTRLTTETESYRIYEVVLDVYPDVIASGMLLLPRDLKPGDSRPVIVCQHGLEGTPTDTLSGPDSKGFRAYKGFAAELAKRGFIVYSPQNPYRGGDAFRTLQRKSNLVGRSLFSYIIPQHLVTLRWLASLEFVDDTRIGFYGLSYGGKTAVRVPPMLPPTTEEPGYCLSICSADFNEWVAKNASTEAPFSYVWTPEYEIFEWNMAHVANYAELSMLMTPRPFMVERGHDDGVGIDEWVAWEYAKVRRHYNKLGIGDKTEIEFFDGPHTIHGQGTYDFLHHHLRWPKPSLQP